MNNKKNRQYFVKEAINICFETGALRCVKSDLGTKFLNKDIEVTIPPENEHYYLYSVFVKFTTPCRLGNKYSGKHNFHAIGDAKEAVAYFEDHLKESLAAPVTA